MAVSALLIRSALGVLVNKPFRMWVKVAKVVEGHGTNKDFVEIALAFKRSIEQPQRNIWMFV